MMWLTLQAIAAWTGSVGLALGLAMLILREIVRKDIFPVLDRKRAFRLLRLVAVCAFLIAALALVVWAIPQVFVVGDGNTIVR